MNTTTSTPKDDDRQTPQELERDADRARGDLDRTLEALEERISPSALADRTMRLLRENGGEFGHNLATQVRDHPLPAILAGIGIAWLFVESGPKPHRADHSADAHARGAAGGGLSSVTTATRSAAAQAADATRDAVTQAANATRSAAGHAADSTRQMMHDAAVASRSVSTGYSHLSREHPLALAALAVAAGAVLGALLPATEVEEELLGESQTIASLRGEAQRRWQQVKSTASDIAEETVAQSESLLTGGAHRHS